MLCKTRCITRQEACYQTHIYSTLMSYMLNKLCTYCTHPLHLSKYLIAPWRAVHASVCSAFMHTIVTTPGHLLLCNARVFKCPIWAVMIKRKGSKVKSAGFFLQRRNVVVMALCTSLCSAVQGRATVNMLLFTGGTGAYRL